MMRILSFLASWFVMPGFIGSCFVTLGLVLPSPVTRADPDATRPCRFGPSGDLEMVVIASGRFLMGSPRDEKGRRPTEGPPRGVSVVNPFAMSRCEITVAEFRRFVEDVGYRTDAERGQGCITLKDDGSDWERRQDRNWRDPGFPQTGHDPVVCVSWNDARAHAYWVSLRTGYEYRLPTEAEWEYAARATRAVGVPSTLRRRYWGNDVEDKKICEFANGADPTLKERVPKRPPHINENCWDNFAFTAPAASFRSNAFGLFDMLGNAWEWTADCWRENYRSAPMDGGAWGKRNRGDCARRVIRGGGWESEPGNIRSATRDWGTSSVANATLGFRLVMEL
uniref:Formylglycine-generating enzyme, required for sulfatase activity, contains SUMF1/FGE domain n=1 Tax=Candidatus Kentrum sp. SD TaxID=2126332 RepID=A0A450Y6K8_9GAMM|nr:MAG: Formylglycine-generating enzyme, required for sulfatase activity, contains SUMF1/FGE domain [Candidatus Kentron sp. SD]VFK39706.1 MAG: Formylglycine-generating enzyme, required for sulfatase activity, contains SUMF1/FGE domain [Candidatus Kentron sp. SD]